LQQQKEVQTVQFLSHMIEQRQAAGDPWTKPTHLGGWAFSPPVACYHLRPLTTINIYTISTQLEIRYSRCHTTKSRLGRLCNRVSD